MAKLNNMQITYNEISNNKYIQIYLTEEELKIQEIKLKTAMEYFDEIISEKVSSKYILENIIYTIWIYSDKTVKIDLKMDIEKLI